MDDFLTSSEVAALFGVTPMTIVRWTEAGKLPCEKTAGQHRRYRRSDVEALRAASRPADDGEVDNWISLLRRTSNTSVVASRLLSMHARLGTWDRVADAMAPVLTEIGARWASGALSVYEEHLASEQLQRGIARVCEWLPQHPNAPRALLATPEGEQHTLGLSLAELTLRGLAWRTDWIGRSTPVDELVRAVGESDVALLALSASASAKNGGRLAKDVRLIERACADRGTTIVLGGTGAWPKRPGSAIRVSHFADLARAASRR